MRMAPVYCDALFGGIVTALRRRALDDALMPDNQRGPRYYASDRFVLEKLLEVGVSGARRES
jgi:hypothetical protein